MLQALQYLLLLHLVMHLLVPYGSAASCSEVGSGGAWLLVPCVVIRHTMLLTPGATAC